jgi:hypothetical protein
MEHLNPGLSGPCSHQFRPYERSSPPWKPTIAVKMVSLTTKSSLGMFWDQSLKKEQLRNIGATWSGTTGIPSKIRGSAYLWLQLQRTTAYNQICQDKEVKEKGSRGWRTESMVSELRSSKVSSMDLKDCEFIPQVEPSTQLCSYADSRLHRVKWSYATLLHAHPACGQFLTFIFYLSFKGMEELLRRLRTWKVSSTHLPWWVRRYREPFIPE